MPNLVYNSESYSVLAYPAQQGYELLDKEGQRSLFIQGAQAQCFMASIEAVATDDPEVETIDAFLDEYCAGSARPIVYQ